MCYFLPNPSQYHQSHEFFLATFDELSTGRPLYIEGHASQPAFPNRHAAELFFYRSTGPSGILLVVSTLQVGLRCFQTLQNLFFISVPSECDRCRTKKRQYTWRIYAWMALWRKIDTLGVELCVYIIIKFHSNIVSTYNHIIQAGGAACGSESTEARQGTHLR